jgi:hypothetical protein
VAGEGIGGLQRSRSQRRTGGCFEDPKQTEFDAELRVFWSVSGVQAGTAVASRLAKRLGGRCSPK